MLKPRLVVSILLVGTIVLCAGVALAQDFPNRPLRIVLSGSTGGSDFAARLIAPGISNTLGQPVIVDNRAGLVAQEIVSKSPPDGYNMLIVGTNQWIGPLLRKMPYDPITDFAPITLVARAPSLLIVHPSVPVKSIKELIAFAKAKPGELNYSSGGIGGSGHLSGELFNSLAGVNTVHVPFQSTSQRLSDLLSGQIHMTFDSGSSLIENIKAGKLRALAVTSAKPTALFPDLSTVAASLPGYESESRTAMFATAKTPEAIINRLRREIATLLNQADVKQKFFNSGAETVGSSPEELAATIKSEVTRWSKVIKDAGIKAL